ncbi:MAG: roadblock/LC7 domain-containing protein [ANME-2 cluster archaeon]|jgi:predicted regulator of Ras-like GTPase activity (Roadblock/LC7/MglB family)|nr:MAG: roadblock/LC7 domain-containing protein [ANME-2 cluster archaeon]NOQ29057.1 roadblock/LC7 domain-containing protein [Methanosarcinales archaeon]
MATTEMLNKVLSDLMKTGEIESSVIASRDGLLMVSRMQKGDDETFAAMSATMLGAAETASAELEKGIPDRVIVESNNGKLVAIGAGPKALVVVLTPPDVSLGLVLVELGKAADEIKKILT